MLVRPGSQRREVPVNRPRTVIGRRDDCQIRVPDGGVSRQHCELLRTDNGLSVRDLGSSNGTYVNREKVVEKILQAGDLLAVGPCVFVVRMDGEPAEIDPGAGAKGVAPHVGGAKSSGEAKTISVKPTTTSPMVDENQGSSEFDFDFDLDDDDQPKL